MSAADFTLLPPIPITDALLTSINVPEVAAGPVYNAGTTYALGAIAGTVSGTLQTMYESLQAGNIGHTQTSSPTWWRLVGIAYIEYNAGTSYALNDIVGTTVGTVQTIYKSLQAANVGHTQSSSPTWWSLIGVVYSTYDKTVTYALADIVTYITTDIHKLYKSAGAGNTGNALTDTTKWTYLGSTNARALFDTTYGSQTSNADTIVFTVTPGLVINSLYLGNLDAASVRIVQSASGYDRTVVLNQHGCLNWYDYWYKLITRMTDLASVSNIPPYPASTLTITISNTGGIAKCGIFVMGYAYVIGGTQWEAMGGIISYSGTSTDAFGNTTFLPRAKVKKLNVEVRIIPGFEDEAFRLLTLYTDVPMVFIASTDYAMAAIYGNLGTWSVPISNSGKNAPIELKGLT